jgi:subtilase family serine protease
MIIFCTKPPRISLFAQGIAVLTPLLFSFSPLNAQTTPTPGQDIGRQQLTGHLTEEVLKENKNDTLIGNTPLDEKLYLSVGFPLRNKKALEEESKSLYDPNSPNYRKFLTPEEYGNRYGISKADYQKAAGFFKSHGFAIDKEFKSRLLITVKGTVDDIQKTFHVYLRNYKRPDGTQYHLPDREPSIDLDIPLLHISGIENIGRVYPGSHFLAPLIPFKPRSIITPETTPR